MKTHILSLLQLHSIAVAYIVVIRYLWIIAPPYVTLKKKNKAKDPSHCSHLVFETQTPAWLGFYITFRCERIWLIRSMIAQIFLFFLCFYMSWIWPKAGGLLLPAPEDVNPPAQL